MKAVFFLSSFWLVYVYVGYPMILVCIARLRRVAIASSDSFLPAVSVLIAARNEAADIGWKIQETLNWDYPPQKLEVLVCSDASDDGTDDIVRSFDSSRVALHRMELRGGKGRALNQLAGLAHGEVLFFTDANTHIKPEILRLMVRHLADGRIACVTGHTQHVQGDDPSLTCGAGVYERYESMLKHLESSLGSVLACDGAIFCMTASSFLPVSPELANDFELPLRTSVNGYWTVVEPAARALERDTSSAAEEFNRRRRMAAQGMLAILRIRGVVRGFRGWQIASHKILRWLLLIPMITALVTSTALIPDGLFYQSAFALQILFYSTAAIGLVTKRAGRHSSRLFAVPFYLLLSVVASCLGVLECFAGKRFDVWEIPTLSRGVVKPTSIGDCNDTTR